MAAQPNSPGKILNGARCIVYINGLPVGSFNTVSWGLTYDAQTAYILGRTSPAAIEYTGQEPVSVSASGWRIFDAGPHQVASIPQLDLLLTSGYLELAIVDRVSGRAIAKIHSCRALGYSNALATKSLLEINYNFIGMLVDDEVTANNEAPGAADLP